MSQTATRPWWADVQHLRPDEDGEKAGERAPHSGRFDRSSRPTSSRVSNRAAASDVRREAERPARAAERPAPAPVDEPAPVERARPEPESWLEEPPAPKPERRTIEIRGQIDRVHGVAPVPLAGPQRIRGRRADERVGPRPDKIAMWAVLLGILLILVALMSSSGADAAAITSVWL